jgi:uncharacterized protein YdhG (YjbR/CyaY superfamily)
MRTPVTVSAYISSAPKASQPLLRQLRNIVHVAAPSAEEKVSYGMPYYSLHGRLVYFAGYEKHVAVYVMDASRRALPKALQQYRTSKSTLRFPVGSKLPVALLTKLIRTQARANTARV